MLRKQPTPGLSELDGTDQRRLVFLLINLYQLQLVRGCGNDGCNTLTCYTYRKSYSSKPLRRLTPTSARAAAFFLADRKDPEAQLCPHVVHYVLSPLTRRRDGSEVTMEKLIGFTDHIANMSNTDSELAAASRQDPSSFSQRLFNSFSAKNSLKKVTKASETDTTKTPPSSVRVLTIQDHHNEMAGAGDILQLGLERFHQHRDTSYIALAFTTAITKLVSFSVFLKSSEESSSGVLRASSGKKPRQVWDEPDQVGLRLATAVVNCFARLRNLCFGSAATQGSFVTSILEQKSPRSPEEHLTSVVLSSILSSCATFTESELSDLHTWIKPIFLGAWDKKAIVSINGLAGAALMFADILRYSAQETNLILRSFDLRLQDPYQASLQWRKRVSTGANDGFVCLLEYPWILSSHSQAQCLRASCLHRMADAVGESGLNLRLLRGSASGLVSDVQNFPPEVLSIQAGQLQIATSSYLTLQVDRGNIVEDALASLWHRQERELFRPLKVKMSNAGEVGVDQGGLAQEFFRVVFSHVFEPGYAIFSVDERTRMAWFDPKSLEPLYKFELLGILMALAVFNGFTLPVNFPLALYRKLCNLQVNTLAHIEDGWQDLTRGLRQLLEWKDGDVSDIFSRTYVFTFEAFGKMVHVDMTRDTDDWSPIVAMTSNSTSEEDAPLVTNITRERYVRDYIQWLTDKSVGHQYNAFARGFHRILNLDILRTVEPHVLRNIVEGERNIDTFALQKVARYDAGYCSHKPYIHNFWNIVHSFDEVRKKQLLEFVTASDRIPVSGMETVDFVIQRHGGDTESLPTSVTCFGRLLLPQYSSKEKLKRKLELALENSKGFGLS